MKRIISILSVIAMCAVMVLPFNAFAVSASVKLKGPDALRAGDTITLSFELSGNGISGASGTLSYDSNQVTLTGTSQKIKAPWAVEFNGNNFVAYDNELSSPINGTKTVFTVTFKVKSPAVGTNVKISYTDVKASDGNADINIGTVSYSATVAAPLSKENDLAELTVSNAAISPAFSADTTSYTASVPFEVSKLDVKATAADGKARVSVNSPNLVPNAVTNVTVTVTAENGDKKVYTISVKREQDPNYVASSNNYLSDIAVEGFLLSPVFDKDITQYVVWLPYEITQLSISGSPQDGNASVEVFGGDELVAGQDNIIKVICTAENGDKKEYTVIAKRAGAHGENISTPTASTEPTVENTKEVGNQTTEPVTEKPTQTVGEVIKQEVIPWWMIAVCGLALVIGFICGFAVKLSSRKN